MMAVESKLVQVREDFSPRRDLLRRLRKSPAAMVGGIILAAIILATVLAPFVAPYSPTKIEAARAFSSPSFTHPLGTDHFGRDMLSRILFGGRLSLSVGLIAVAIAGTFGITLGVMAGYMGGWVDTVISRLIDVLLAFPSLLLTLGIVIILGAGLENLMIAVGISSIPGFARIVRGSVISTKENTYVQASIALGCSPSTVMIRHILPNVMAPIIVYATLRVASAILAGASLSYLGMGAQPPTPEGGLMLSDGREHMRRAWWITTFPGVAIMLTVMSINLLGDGLRDALDPRLRS